MDYYPTLCELLVHSPKSKALFVSIAPEIQTILQKQKQTIHTYADLQKIAFLFAETPCRK